jgi:NADH-quinone oxidoreductase subunit N
MIALVLAATTLKLPQVNYTTILPELILLGGALALLAVTALFPRQLETETLASLTVGFGIAALIASLFLWHDVQAHGPFLAIAGAIDADGFAVLGLILASSIIIVAAMLAPDYLRKAGVVGCEYYALALISASGAMFMASANDLILIFLALEILSIPLYVMAALDQRRSASGEAGMKYFVLGAFSSAIFVYGIALIYGATGSTNLASISAFLARNVIVSNGVLLAGLALLLVGFGFKVAAVPFHMWTPDVYDGAPTPAVGFMAAIAKVGAFTALLRVLMSGLPTLRGSFQPALWIIVTITVLLGALVAIAQRNVKRMLAYSSINHAGFILLGVQAATARGISSSLYYIFVYAFLVLGSFAVVGIVGSDTEPGGQDLERYRGLGRRHPVLGVSFAILLLAQAGAPFTTGFFSKFYVVEAAAEAHSYALAVIAMASAAIAAYFYLRLVFVMFGEVELETASASFGASGSGSATLSIGAGATATVQDALPAVSGWVMSGLGLCVATTVVFGIWPQPLLDLAHQATLLF